MQVTHPFDVSLVVRARRHQLKLRQIELARAAGVSREWLIDFERGKPGMDFNLVLKTLKTLEVTLSIHYCGPAPGWSKPLTEAALSRQRRLDAIRPRRPRKCKERPGPKAPEDWFDGV